LVRGENIAQTFQFVASGNAELGFVALAQLRAGKGRGGSMWEVPATYHRPLAQQVILLHRARDTQAARQLLDYLHGAEARQVLERFGYGAPGG
jgi:molybdate transport system substrate-binding protein